MVLDVGFLINGMRCKRFDELVQLDDLVWWNNLSENVDGNH